MLEKEGAVQVQFVSQTNWYEKRKEIFRDFKGIDIAIDRVSKSEAHVLLINEKIRTSFEHKVQSEQKSADELHYPKQLSLKSRGTLNEFEKVENAIVEMHGIKVYPCACCGRYLPEDKFGKRKYGSATYRQSYCIYCMRCYGLWRKHFLSEHNIDKLAPKFTGGHKQRNEIFHTWYVENVEGK
jgi:hypothetical protein